MINETVSLNLFELLTMKNFDVWLGFAFERFCDKNAYYFASIMRRWRFF